MPGKSPFTVQLALMRAETIAADALKVIAESDDDGLVAMLVASRVTAYGLAQKLEHAGGEPMLRALVAFQCDISHQALEAAKTRQALHGDKG